MTRVLSLQNFSAKLHSLFLRRTSWGLILILVGGGSVLACGDGADDDESSSGDGDGDGSGGAEGSGGSGGAEGSGGSEGTGGATALPLLSETGLYEADMVTLAPGVRTFTPQFKLWSDAAEKKRWIYLPEGTQIDTSDMNFWSYPAGTKLFKEFSRDDVRVETRLLEKLESGVWFMMAFHWREDQTEADAVPDGVMNASGTAHDIPGQTICGTCHSKVTDKVLGFTAVQLSLDVPETPGDMTLNTLIDEELLTAPPAGLFAVPGTDVQKDALGYLHANCGTCHNPTSSVQARTDMELWLDVTKLGSLEETPTYLTTVGQETTVPEEQSPGTTLRIVAGDPSASDVYGRMNSRGFPYSMPAAGSEVIDAEGVATVEAFINSL